LVLVAVLSIFPLMLRPLAAFGNVFLVLCWQQQGTMGLWDLLQVRDPWMRKLVPDKREPITPFISKV